MKLMKMLLGFPLLIGLSIAFAADGGQHCVVRLQPVQPGDTVSWTQDLGCFPTFSEAIKKATGVDISPNVTPASITQADVSAAATYIIGIDFTEENYQGPSMTWTTDDPQGCYDQYYTANEPDNFNDKVRSTMASADIGCTLNINYQDADQNGWSFECRPSCPYVDLQNWLISSKKWCYKECPPAE